MKAQKYSVNQHLISTLLAFVKSGTIAIPEIQRPFVWDSTKVRDLMDSLYKGYPIGYIIAWTNPNIRLKDGSLSQGKKILIDGQQRITALSAAILGNRIVNKEYKRVNITIAYHPQEERFEVLNPAIERDVSWIPDISVIFNEQNKMFAIVQKYCTDNPNVSQEEIFEKISKLISIINKQIGMIDLEPELDIETVTEIFIRINSKGVVLSQADFVMSKIASNEEYNGNLLRKCIDYFCHLAIAPEFYGNIEDVDKEFVNTEFFQKIKWLKNEVDDLYDPDYNDLIRVSFTSEFNRGRLSDLVSLLSGRNFETRTYEQTIEEESFNRLKQGVLNFVNETNFKNILMILRSAGFIDKSLISSTNTVNFAYILYLKLKSKRINYLEIEKVVRKWYVFSSLTGRYTGSPESKFDSDIKNFEVRDHNEILSELELAELSDAFWDVGLVQQLQTSNINSPAYNSYLAAMTKLDMNSFLSTHYKVKVLIDKKGDIHHLFPKDYLKKKDFTKSQYNQVANFVYLQTEINIRIGNKPPIEYFSIIKEQYSLDNNFQQDSKIKKICDFTNDEQLIDNLKQNDIPMNILNYSDDEYFIFLEERRKLMAQKIKLFYSIL